MARPGPEARTGALRIPPGWHLADALARQPGLRLVPAEGPDVLIAGEIHCYATGPGGEVVNERYAVTIEVPLTFPREMPRVVETEGRIPRGFHRNPDNSLCLGSPIGQTLTIEEEPTIGAFIDRVLVPYFYGYVFRGRHDRMPFGELAHGVAGLADDVRRLFRLPGSTCAEAFLRLAGLRRRHGNKRACPCGSGRRVGRCHRAAVHEARRRLGRSVCRAQREFLAEQRAAEGGRSLLQGRSGRARALAALS